MKPGRPQATKKTQSRRSVSARLTEPEMWERAVLHTLADNLGLVTITAEHLEILLGLDRKTASRHLRTLEQAGQITAAPTGKRSSPAAFIITEFGAKVSRELRPKPTRKRSNPGVRFRGDSNRPKPKPQPKPAPPRTAAPRRDPLQKFRGSLLRMQAKAKTQLNMKADVESIYALLLLGCYDVLAGLTTKDVASKLNRSPRAIGRIVRMLSEKDLVQSMIAGGTTHHRLTPAGEKARRALLKSIDRLKMQRMADTVEHYVNTLKALKSRAEQPGKQRM